MTHDVCILGHVTRDRIIIPGQPDTTMPGGAAYYVSLALASLGRKVIVVTKVANEDADELLSPLRDKGIDVVVRKSATTTVFENAYGGDQLSERQQRVPSLAEAFVPEDLDGISCRALHLGSLSKNEAPLSVWKRARDIAETVSMDVQGVLRRTEDEQVVLTEWAEAKEGLPLIDVLKADDAEAKKVVGEGDAKTLTEKIVALGTREVLLTFADLGSFVRGPEGVGMVPAIPARKVTDATGCGDTYLAGYLHRRLDGAEPRAAATFAAAAASLKLEHHGAFDGTVDDVKAHLERWREAVAG